jgi:hypothetical protein
MALALNVVFKWEQDEPGYEYKIFTHKTRLFTQTVNAGQLSGELNSAVQGGFEVYFGFKHLTRFLMIIPRETYFFVLRRRMDGANRPVTYRFVEYGYRFFTNTLDPVAYEKVLNEQGMDSRHVVSFRDERRLFGMFRQIIALTLFEDGPPQAAFQQPQGYQQLPQQGQGYPQQPQGYPQQAQGYPPPGYPQR